MKPNEIKQNMTHGEWRGKDTTYIKEEQFVVTPEDGGTPWVACERAIFANDVLLGSLWMQTAPGGWETVKTVTEISADHAAIVTAVNGTYGVGIDPCMVSDMVKMLQNISEHHSTNPITRNSIKSLLNSAKL